MRKSVAFAESVVYVEAPDWRIAPKKSHVWYTGRELRGMKTGARELAREYSSSAHDSLRGLEEFSSTRVLAQKRGRKRAHQQAILSELARQEKAARSANVPLNPMAVRYLSEQHSERSVRIALHNGCLDRLEVYRQEEKEGQQQRVSEDAECEENELLERTAEEGDLVAEEEIKHDSKNSRGPLAADVATWYESPVLPRKTKDTAVKRRYHDAPMVLRGRPTKPAPFSLTAAHDHRTNKGSSEEISNEMLPPR